MNNSEHETLSGKVTRILMRDWQTGYTVFTLQQASAKTICSGVILNAREGMNVDVTGTWENTKYGRQLASCEITEKLNDPDSILDLLRIIPGVGEASARTLISKFGDRIVDVASSADAIAKLSSVPGISTRRAEAIAQWFLEHKEQERLFRYLLRFGAGYASTAKIYRRHGATSLSALQSNPYVVGRDAGLSHSVCDAIAQDAEIKPFDERRVIGTLIYILSKAATAGNAYVPYNEAIVQTKKALGVSPYTETIATACIGRVLRRQDKGFVLVQDRLYLEEVDRQERRTAFAVRRLLRTAKPLDFSISDTVSKIEKKLKVNYDNAQKEAFSLLQSGGMGIVTGGPGTGKSTVLLGLVTAYKQHNPKGVIRLCAPTGRAAQRMSETTGIEAQTIHKLLDYTPYGDVVSCRNETNPIDADLIIIDECSMLSIEVAELLFSAIKSGTTVILVGDIDQLPAVGAGNVLHDLIETNMIPVVSLTKTFRQQEGSTIVTNAKRIREGVTSVKAGDDFEILFAEDKDIPEIVLKEFSKVFDSDNPFACQVITPTRRRYDTSAAKLNQIIQRTVGDATAPHCVYGGTTYRCGDKVIFLRNNYEEGYMNGDMGVVSEIKDGAVVIDADGVKYTVDRINMDDLSLAYSITVHKSQGAESDTVIVALPAEPSNMLQRNLLYTAITRAKKKVILVAGHECVSRAVTNKSAARRRSTLVDRIKERTFFHEYPV